MRPLVIVAVLALAQTPTFEVASVKRSPPDATRIAPGGLSPGGSWRSSNSTLLQIIQRAFDQYSRPGLIVGGPPWIRSDRWEISAKAEGDPPRAQMLLMMQQLLAERFKLQTHIDTRPVDIYTLVKARPDGRLGPRLRPSEVNCAALRASGERVRVLPMTPVGVPQCGSRSTLLPNGVSRLAEGGWLLRQVVLTLQSWTDRIIVDRTGLDGEFDVNLEFAFETRNAPDRTDSAGVSLFTALQEQLGLKLESRREPMSVLVIDSAERPTPD
jgi:uncharacterized protein (TIGR03435 family)